MTYRQSNQDEHKDIIKTMSVNLGKENNPKVGIFWYSPSKKELFDVNSMYASDARWNSKGKRTTRILYQDIWEKNKRRAERKGDYNSIYMQDYTQFPRGRIFEVKDKGFEIMAGSWIKEDKEIVELILEEFDLPADKTEVVIDSHWEIGHGWSNLEDLT